MKLKDIFNIDLSTRGGAKLYRKIMGKYNIPKQDSKQLVKEIRNSSNGDNAKYGYYKLTQYWLNILNNYDTARERFEMLIYMFKYIECNGICGVHYQTGDITYIDHSSLLLLVDNRNNWPYFDIATFNLGIKVNEDAVRLNVLHTVSKDENVNNILQGNLKERMALIGISSEEFDGIFQIITEEEYEHLLNNINNIN